MCVIWMHQLNIKLIFVKWLPVDRFLAITQVHSRKEEEKRHEAFKPFDPLNWNPCWITIHFFYITWHVWIGRKTLNNQRFENIFSTFVTIYFVYSNNTHSVNVIWLCKWQRDLFLFQCRVIYNHVSKRSRFLFNNKGIYFCRSFWWNVKI